MINKWLFAAKNSAATHSGNQPVATEALSGPTPANQQLKSLNRDFLHLLLQAQTQASQRWQAQLGMLPAQQQLLASCRHSELERIAGCGFSLFNASFHQPEVWAHLCSHSNRMAPEQRYAVLLPRTETALQRICIGIFQTVVFFAWHLARQDAQAARLTLGMAEETAQVMTRLDLWQCQFIAHHHCNLLTPRWRHNPYFWTDLLNYGQSGDTQLLRFVRAMGTQLIAQELEPSAVARLSRRDEP